MLASHRDPAHACLPPQPEGGGAKCKAGGTFDHMTDRIETLLDEQRTFPPPAGFTAQAHVRDTSIYEKAKADREGYWADWARQLEWMKPWDRVLEWTPPPSRSVSRTR